ncbi:SAF domain-containing protein [Corynebacterium meridianum]|uniref:SAF domain-containing protein n=1 Tax=Corynebacterium meridianum TaxID=2765363 RepID=A0A934HZK6_9CORY|nr:SAF domain-containing protein [Corynebacterium meridianum]MBI8988540.1 hypothetical protein [Corynebacterium meridianum]MCK7677996.1 SAF domain-containing protein [Corynebacterium meridianum]
MRLPRRTRHEARTAEPPDRWRSTVNRALTPGWRRHRALRRCLALILVVSSAVTAVTSTRNDDPWAVTLAHPVDAGAELRREDLKLVRVPPALHPEGTLDSVAAAVGRIVVASVDPGQILTTTLLVDPGTTARMFDGWDQGPGRGGPTLVPLRLADPAVVPFLIHGDTVTVLSARDDSAGGPSDHGGPGVGGDFRVIATEARVVLAGAPADHGGQGADTVLLALPEQDARTVAAISLTSPVTVVLTGSRAGRSDKPT